MASTAQGSSGPWIDFLSVLIFPTFQSLGSCVELEAVGQPAALFTNQAAPKGRRAELGSGRTALAVLSQECKRYFGPIELLIKHLNTLAGLVRGVKERSLRWSGRRQGTSSDGAGIWSLPRGLGCCSPGKEKSFRDLFHIQSTFPRPPQTCQWVKRKTCCWQKVLEAETKLPVTDGTSLTDLIALRHLHATISGLLQAPADSKQKYF